jgi:hypothetical protein
VGRQNIVKIAGNGNVELNLFRKVRNKEKKFTVKMI